jgi:hypothetical protein
MNLHQTLRRFGNSLHRLLRLDSFPPADHGINLVLQLSFLGKVAITVNGAGLVAAIALIIAAYTSIAGASNPCLASGFVAHTIEKGQDAARLFYSGGVLSLLVAGAPGLAGFVRNYKWTRRPCIPVGKDLLGLTSWKAWVIFGGQMLLLLLSVVSCTTPAIHIAMDRQAYTQESIQTMWGHFEEGCKPASPNPPDLT